MDKESISSKASLAGIGVNIVLCTVKLVSGFLTNSIAILSDGFNNLTDIGNAILIFIGYRIARKPADREHPYGHGRVEYMLSQGIAQQAGCHHTGDIHAGQGCPGSLLP